MRLLLTADPNESLVRSYIATAHVLLCRVQDELAGVAAVIQKPVAGNDHDAVGASSTCELINIAVDPAFQGNGLAKALIQESIALAKGWGARAIDVGTGNSSLNQLALYQKCGFRLHHIERDFFADYPEPIIENGMRCIDKVILRIEL